MARSVTFAQFPARMNALAKEVKVYRGRVEDVTTRRTVEVLVETTPVDTSKALSNWLVGRGRPRRAIIPAHFPGKGGSTARQSRRATIKAAAKAIKSFKTRPVFVSNNVPYMDKLNKGGSTQAPANFIEMALLAAKQAVRRTRIFKRARRLSNRLS